MQAVIYIFRQICPSDTDDMHAMHPKYGFSSRFVWFCCGWASTSLSEVTLNMMHCAFFNIKLINNSIPRCCHSVIYSGIIQGMGLVNEWRRYNMKSSLIGWAHIQNDPRCLICHLRCGSHHRLWGWLLSQWCHNERDGVLNPRRAYRLFAQPFVQAPTQENIKAPRHWPPVDSPHKGPVARKMFPFDDVIMIRWIGKS